MKICEILFKNWKWLFENINQTSFSTFCLFLFFYSKKFEDEMFEDRIRTEDRLVREFKVLEYHTNCKVTIYIHIYFFLRRIAK